MEAFKKTRTPGNGGFKIVRVWKESNSPRDYFSVTDCLVGKITVESLDFRDGDRITFEVEGNGEQQEVEGNERSQEE